MGRTLVDVLAHPVTSVRCSNDGNALLASTTDGRIRMLDRSDGKLLKAFGGDDVSPGQGNSNATYRKSDLRIRSIFAKADAIVLSGSAADDSGNGNGATQASVFAWDVLSGEVVACVPAGPGVKAVSAVSWNEKGNCWAGGCSDGMSQLSMSIFVCATLLYPYLPLLRILSSFSNSTLYLFFSLRGALHVANHLSLCLLVTHQEPSKSIAKFRLCCPTLAQLASQELAS